MSENINKNNDLEQEMKTRNFKALAIFVLSIFLVIGIVVWVLFKKDSTTNTPKEEDKTIQNSVKQKEFKETPFEAVIGKNFEAKNEPQNLPSQTTQPASTLKQTSYVKPRIIKGMGVALVSSNANNEATTSSVSAQTNSDLTLQDKPNTVFEFGQNGSVNLASNVSSGNSMQGEVFTPSVASYSQFNPSLLLPKGTYIGCALKTRLVSEVKGGIACIVSSDVYSNNGHTLLIEKGSTITGTYSGGELNDGSTRLFVIWQEVRTPNNIIIPVNSGATDELGASGVEGYVNYHYMKRFGAAILLSVIDDAFAVIADKLSNNSKNNYYDYTENSREQASKIAEIALEKMIDIKPTLYKNQGDLVGVYVNRDIDFSKVYQLRRKR